MSKPRETTNRFLLFFSVFAVLAIAGPHAPQPHEYDDTYSCAFWLGRLDNLAMEEAEYLRAKYYKQTLKAWKLRRAIRRAQKEIDWFIMSDDSYESEL